MVFSLVFCPFFAYEMKWSHKQLSKKWNTLSALNWAINKTAIFVSKMFELKVVHFFFNFLWLHFISKSGLFSIHLISEMCIFLISPTLVGAIMKMHISLIRWMLKSLFLPQKIEMTVSLASGELCGSVFGRMKDIAHSHTHHYSNTN